jgi:chromosome segregation ATPase
MSNCDCNQGRLPCSCKQNDTQSELAALREELAEWKARAGRRTAERTEFMNQRDDAQQRLAAAEQRNAVLTGLLEEALGSVYVDAGKCDNTQVWKETVDLASRIELAIKPAELAATSLDPKIIGIVPMPPMEHDEP